ncbi:ABC transporter ATP-binding protein [Fastidiosipila sanguinis]|uniref:ATP-binding protein n=1 Tax=Fastidiosipila sanguinis TaxID=236753 RepID=A0A2S0KMZ6_9FIRM|nr:ABC transporter ATP-binding protein [Fastidiosipila sanguinis]AVM42384.1 ATP-binding protein [Fastidiosipila sanguinis]
MEKESKKSSSAFLRIAGYIKPFKLQAIVGPAAKMIEAVIELLIPLIMAKMIDSIPKHQGDSKFFLLSGLGLLLIVIASFGFSCICQYMASVASQGVGTHIRRDLYKKIQTFSFRQLDKFGAVSLSNRLTLDIGNIQFAVAKFIRLLFRAPLLIIGSTVAAFIISPSIALIFIPIIIFIFALLIFLMSKTIPMQVQAQEDTDELGSLVQDQLGGIRIIRAFNRSKHEKDFFLKNNKALNFILEKIGKLSALLTPGSALIINLATIFVLVLGGDRIQMQTLTAGELIALINYLGLVLQGVTVLTTLLVEVPRIMSSCERLAEALDTEPEIQVLSEEEINLIDSERYRTADPKSAKTYALEVAGAKNDNLLCVNSIDFAYARDAKPVLAEISFALNRGESLGIIGATGSGKSSLARIIQRFYEASFGQIYINGKDIRNMERAEIIQNITYVPQKPLLFTGTIRENISLGLSEAEKDELANLDKRLWDALEIAQAKDFVEGKQNGLDAEVERNGRNFSGGQRQRLSIARALALQTPIVIFDDSASALDYATEAKLNNAIRNLSWKPAMIYISQRVRSMQNMDKIILLDTGRIVAEGTHEELLENSQLYKEIYLSQEKPVEAGDNNE